jgi:hypothetical protein
MFADPKKVAGRRFRRRVKAGAAVVLAMFAGAFLACKGTPDEQPASPMGPDARRGPGPQDADAGAGLDATMTNDANTDANDAGDAGDDATSDALALDAASDSNTTLAVRDASVDAAAKAPRVDKHEHRKGMPVRDNLLE